MRQSLGIIGGRPNHALYFIGVVGNELVYLDPHSTQLFVDLDEPNFDDSSYHCQKPLRMEIGCLDPSIALSFYCHTEEDFDSWCNLVHKLIIVNEKQPLFELTKQRPPCWPVPEQQDKERICSTANAVGTDAFTLLEEGKLSETEEEFEMLG